MPDECESMMEKWSLTALADSLLTHAFRASSHRSTRTVHGGPHHDMRQTVIALVAGQTVNELDIPGAATVQVLRGRVRIAAGDDTTDGSAGQLLIVPDVGHSMQALEDAVVLVTVASPRGEGQPSRSRTVATLRA